MVFCWRGGREVEGAALEMLFRGNSNEGSNPSLSAILAIRSFLNVALFLASPSPLYLCFSMVACIGPPATISCESRQAWKGAAEAVTSGAGVSLVEATTSFWRVKIMVLRVGASLSTLIVVGLHELSSISP